MIFLGSPSRRFFHEGCGRPYRPPRRLTPRRQRAFEVPWRSSAGIEFFDGPDVIIAD